MGNNWRAKVCRSLASFFPVSRDRVGSWVRRGKCCSLPNKRIFLREKNDWRSSCLIYPVSPGSCKKYPRTEKEHMTAETCGFSFGK